MDKRTALTILEGVHKDYYEQWIIPHHYQSCKKEITLSDGNKAIILVEDAVYDFIDYVKKLIENAED